MPKPPLQRRAPLPLQGAQKQATLVGVRNQAAAGIVSPSKAPRSAVSPKHAHPAAATGAPAPVDAKQATQTPAGPPALQRRGHASAAAAAVALASSTTRPSLDRPIYLRGSSAGHAESDSDDDSVRIGSGSGREPDAMGADDVDGSDGAYTSDAYSDDGDNDHDDAHDLLLTLGPSVEYSPVEEKKTITPSLSPSLLTGGAGGARKLRQRGRTVSFDGNNLSAREASLRNARGHSRGDALACAHEIPAAAATGAVSASTASAAATPCSPSHASVVSSSSSCSFFSHRHLGGSSGVSPALDSTLSSAGSSPSMASSRRRPPLLALDTQFECSDEYIASMDSMRLATVLATEENSPPTGESQRERREQRRSARKQAQAQALESHYPHQQQQQPQMQAQQLFTRATRLDAEMVVSDSDNFSDAYSDLDCGLEDAGPRVRRAPPPAVTAPRAHLYAPPSIPSAIPVALRSPSSAAASAGAAGASASASPVPLSPYVARRSPKSGGGLLSTPTLSSPSNKRSLAPSHSLPSLGGKRGASPPSPSTGANGHGLGSSDRDRSGSGSGSAAPASSVRAGAAFPTLGRSASSAILPPSPSSAGSASHGYGRVLLSPSRRAVSNALPAALSPQAQLRTKRVT